MSFRRRREHMGYVTELQSHWTTIDKEVFMLTGAGIRIFRISGINIHIDPSWFFIFFLLVWSLAGGVFPAWHPDWSWLQNVVLGVAAALLFFASVLAHELAHALVAKSRGLPVRRITLFLFGGVSNLEREPESARTEFLIAAVGPIVSLILGFLFWAAANGLAGSSFSIENPLAAMSRLGPLATLLMWLGPTNILVGIFNLIPGFPLDGGRILRSIVWGATGNLQKSTNLAAGVGQFVGWSFIFIGVAMFFGIRIPFFGAGALSGVWLAFIGWFLNNAAARSSQQLIIQDLLGDVPVTRLMRSDVPIVPADTKIDELVNEWILRYDEPAFPVMEEDRLIGLVSLEDVRRINKNDWKTTPVSAIMTPAEKITYINPDEDSAEALTRLARKNVRQLPVIQDGHLLGILRRRDILRWLQVHTDLSAK
jgi:Zn-dependent protease/predicted transcriptional regulator